MDEPKSALRKHEISKLKLEEKGRGMGGLESNDPKMGLPHYEIA